ncbi:restriction endonuclease subunit S [Aliarcobacter skirrowii]|uniref:restriction endonuclease subunit S n=1 Tax=Aliarcobacter skirrowii TaxID=28200 RepID=UPI000835533C|nr:restriction endonuclease subunit S [Aliarcobacter skirrowii]
MSSLKRYDNYKDSGVEWLGEIPEHWETQKMKYLGKMFAGLTDKKGDDFAKEISEDKMPFIPFTNVCNNLKIDKNQMQYVKIKPYEKQNKVQKNDIIFLMSSETLDDIGKCSIHLDEEQYYLNSFCKGFRPTFAVNAEFLNYLLQSKTYRNYFALVGRGFTRINIKQEYINDLFAVLPSKEEQTKIAPFLDAKIAQIDEVISQKEKLIELLKERKQIVINDAVTKGLDKDVEMTDSGVEWIGKIPKHWKLLANKYVFNLKKNLVGKKSNEYDLLSLTLEGIIKRDLDKGGKFPAEFDTYQEVKKGDFVFCLFDVEETPRTVGLSKYDGMITGAYTVFSVKNINKEYLYYFYLNLDSKKRLKPLYTGLRNTISKDNFFSFKSFIPPKDEQIKIVEYIENQTTKIDKAIELQQNYISKLKEYKASLIDSVVTGKVKV